MSKHILIITHSEDNECIERVTEALDRKGATAVRFNTDHYPGSHSIDTEYSQGQWKHVVTIEGQAHVVDEFESIWYRRSRIGKVATQGLEKQLADPIIAESRRTLTGLTAATPVFTLDPIPVVRRAETKHLQLRLATEAGLEIPPTLMSNNAAHIRAFAQQAPKPLISKMQGSFAVFDEQGRENVVFTNEMTEEQLADLTGIEISPMTFQSKIAKQVEVRCTIVGTQFFAFALDTNALESTKVDWRRDGDATLENWVPYELPGGVKQKMLQVMDKLGLNYGAADILVTPEGRHVFLEVNPAGEFFWLDRLCKHKISEALAAVLLHEAPRRLGWR